MRAARWVAVSTPDRRGRGAAGDLRRLEERHRPWATADSTETSHRAFVALAEAILIEQERLPRSRGFFEPWLLSDIDEPHLARDFLAGALDAIAAETSEPDTRARALLFWSRRLHPVEARLVRCRRAT